MYFLNDLNFSRRDAGFKARKDALDIASDYENISVVNIPLWGGVVQRIISSVKLSTFLCGLENKDVLIFNFPMAKPFWHILSFFHRLLKFRIVPLIHDIDELRGGGGSDSVRLATCDMVISHNPQMTKYLSKYMSQDKIKDIKIFDYLVSSDVEHRDVTDKQRGVIYAGN
ncbi:TPA: beta-1,6-galactofuranosyltransferase, partial [Escherichia coli]|nr:beta-1,6-galactofuranosyltransferase [Escherichia coli]